MRRTTKAGVTEEMDERDWQHPEHVRGIKPQKIYDNIVLTDLTDKKIDNYTHSGFYSNRRFYRDEARKLKQAQDLFKKKEKRLVYDPLTQEFDER
jgi:hypothetical protein